MTRRKFVAAAVSTAALSTAAPPRSGMGIVIHSLGYNRIKDPLVFLDYAHSLGAAGIQIRLMVAGPEDLKTLRDRAGEWNMYVEGMTALPRTDDTSELEKTLREAKEAGAGVLRAVCLSGRRYETFDSLEKWREFVAGSKAALKRAIPLFEKHKVTLALENHKDWTLEEHLRLLKEYESEYFGVNLDTGNNVALLDDPMGVVEALAPYAAATHLKDMGVLEYEDGFLLAEVPFGEGVLDMKRVIETVRRRRPTTRMSLEMMTRTPLKVPCLTEKYWATFPDRNGVYLARTLAMVKKNKPRGGDLPRPESLPDQAAKIRMEEDNIKHCLNFVRDRVGLVS